MDIWKEIECRTLTVPRLPKIAMGICIMQGVSISDLRAKNRKMDLVTARQKVAKEAKENGYTLEQIGEYLNRDHSTIIHYLKDHQPA